MTKISDLLVIQAILPFLTPEELSSSIISMLIEFPDKVVLTLKGRVMRIYIGLADTCGGYFSTRKRISSDADFLKSYRHHRQSVIIKEHGRDNDEFAELDSYALVAVAEQIETKSKENNSRKLRVKFDMTTKTLQSIDKTFDMGASPVLDTSHSQREKQNCRKVSDAVYETKSMGKNDDVNKEHLKPIDLGKKHLPCSEETNPNETINLRNKCLSPSQGHAELPVTTWKAALAWQETVKCYPVRRKRNGRHPTSQRRPSLTSELTEVNSNSVVHTDEQNITYPVQETQPHALAEVDDAQHAVERDAFSLKGDGACGYTPVYTALNSCSDRYYVQKEEQQGRPEGENETDAVSVITQVREDVPCNTSATQNFIGQPKHLVYIDETARKATYFHWPARLIQDPNRLATEGFFYTGTGDLARCFSCGLGLKGWDSDDDPLTQHIKHTRGCQFLTNLLGADELRMRKEQLGCFVPFQTQISDPTRNEPRPAQQHNLPFAPRHQNYISQAIRESSFARWPSEHSQTPKQLAEAGFFYTGVEDICRCYGCDGGLRRWDPQDDPWIEHAKWFPHCPHVLHVKGVDFVERVRLMMESSDEEDLPQAPIDFVTRSMNQISMQNNSSDQKNRERKKTESEVSPAVQSVQEMGYSRKAIQQCILELRDRGTQYPTAEEMVQVLMDKEERGEILPVDSPPRSPTPSTDSDTDDPEVLYIQNQRLKSLLICVICDIRERNVLTMPCTHHKMCQQCAQSVTSCPECQRPIKQKIKTYMS